MEQVRETNAKPVVAHVERYEFIQDNPQIIYDWHLKGYGIQVNKGSFMGRFGRAAWETAYELLQQLPKVLNCGVDVNFFRPVTLAQLIENNALFYGPDSARYFPDRPPAPAGPRPGLLPRKPDFRPLPER